MIDIQWSSWPVDVATLGRSYAAVWPALAVLAMCPQPVGAEKGDNPAKPVATDRQGAWSFFAAPYGWLEGVSGTVVVDVAEFSWQAAAEIGFRVPRRVMLFAGYRVLA